MDHSQAIQQISLNTKMCLAASNWTVIDEDTLRFRARISNQRNYIYITLNGSDLYDVKQTLVRSGKETTKYIASDIYCDQLDEVIYRMGSTRHAQSGWLGEVGITSA